MTVDIKYPEELKEQDRKRVVARNINRRWGGDRRSCNFYALVTPERRKGERRKPAPNYPA